MRAIEVRGLRKVYGGRSVVDGLTMELEQGELFSLLGVNGAGKTTTIRMLTGMTAPDGGDAWLMGRSIRTEPQQAKWILGVSPQEPAVAGRLSVRENLEFMAEIHGWKPAEARRLAGGMLAEFELGEVERQRAQTLSGGWQRRLSIAMAMIARPQVLFLDEPTLGLDVLARRELWNMLRRLRGRVTILMTTHYMEEAEALSDRIGILQGGRLAAVGTAEELKRRAGKESFEEAFISLAMRGEGKA